MAASSCSAALQTGWSDALSRFKRVDASGVRVCVDMRADLRPAQAQLTDAAFQLARRQIRILHRDRRQARESLRMIAHDFGDVIVQPAGQVERIGRLSPNS